MCDVEIKNNFGIKNIKNIREKLHNSNNYAIE